MGGLVGAPYILGSRAITEGASPVRQGNSSPDSSPRRTPHLSQADQAAYSTKAVFESPEATNVQIYLVQQERWVSGVLGGCCVVFPPPTLSSECPVLLLCLSAPVACVCRVPCSWCACPVVCSYGELE